jgi:hypothetical protein
MFLQHVNLPLSILAGRVSLLGLLLVFRDILFVVCYHVRREAAIELRSGDFRHLVIVRLLLGARPVGCSDTHRFRDVDCLLVGSRMVIVKHLTKLLDVLVLAVLLGKLSHFNFGVISSMAFFRNASLGFSAA